MLHRLCGPPSIHLSFNLAAVRSGTQHLEGVKFLVDIVYGVDYQGI